MRAFARSCIVLAAALLSGCGGARLYEGEQLPRSSVATLVWAPSLDFSSTPAVVTATDGAAVRMWEDHAEVLPGTHTVSGEVNPGSSWPIAFSTTFEAEAGREYEVVGVCPSETDCTGAVRERGAAGEGGN